MYILQLVAYLLLRFGLHQGFADGNGMGLVQVVVELKDTCCALWDIRQLIYIFIPSAIFVCLLR